MPKTKNTPNVKPMRKGLGIAKPSQHGKAINVLSVGSNSELVKASFFDRDALNSLGMHMPARSKSDTILTTNDWW